MRDSGFQRTSHELVVGGAHHEVHEFGDLLVGEDDALLRGGVLFECLALFRVEVVLEEAEDQGADQLFGVIPR